MNLWGGCVVSFCRVGKVVIAHAVVTLIKRVGTKAVPTLPG